MVIQTSLVSALRKISVSCGYWLFAFSFNYLVFYVHRIFNMLTTLWFASHSYFKDQLCWRPFQRFYQVPHSSWWGGFSRSTMSKPSKILFRMPCFSMWRLLLPEIFMEEDGGIYIVHSQFLRFVIISVYILIVVDLCL